WILKDVLRTLNDRQIEIVDFRLPARRLADELKAVESSKLDTTCGRGVFQYILAYERGFIDDAIAALCMEQVSSDDMEKICKELLDANPDVVAKVREGNVKALGALVGQAKKRNPNADPRQVQEICMRIIQG